MQIAKTPATGMTMSDTAYAKATPTWFRPLSRHLHVAIAPSLTPSSLTRRNIEGLAPGASQT